MGTNGNNKEQNKLSGVPRPPPLSLYRGWEEKAAVAKPATTTTASKQPSSLGRSNSMRQAMDSGGSDDGGIVKKRLSKQLSMKETTREVKWEKRRRQIHRRRSSTGLNEQAADVDHVASSSGGVDGGEPSRPSVERAAKAAGRLTDEDLDDLRGSIELGFGFDEEKGGQDLCDTLPALDLYFAVNRQLSEPKMRWSTSSAPSLSASSSCSNLCGTPSPGSPSAQANIMDSWKICSPGDNPQLVKTRLRHWAQVVACSVKHSS